VIEVSSTKPLPAGPVACTPWCEEGDGHPDEYVGDQWCMSIVGSVDCSLEEEWRYAGGVTGPAQTLVRAEKDHGGFGHPAPFVVLTTPRDVAINLTPREARELMRQLGHFAWVAEQDGAERREERTA